MWPVAEVPLWGSLGEDGNEESVISSMSEWEEADFGDFFLLNACLKELRNCRKQKEERKQGDEQVRLLEKLLRGEVVGKLQVSHREKK